MIKKYETVFDPKHKARNTVDSIDCPAVYELYSLGTTIEVLKEMLKCSKPKVWEAIAKGAEMKLKGKK